MDFITSLLVAVGFDTLLMVTYKFLKYIRLVPDKDTWTAEEWATAFYDGVIRY